MHVAKVAGAAGVLLCLGLAWALQFLGRRHRPRKPPWKNFSKVLATNDDTPFLHHHPACPCWCDAAKALLAAAASPARGRAATEDTHAAEATEKAEVAGVVDAQTENGNYQEVVEAADMAAEDTEAAAGAAADNGRVAEISELAEVAEVGEIEGISEVAGVMEVAELAGMPGPLEIAGRTLSGDQQGAPSSGAGRGSIDDSRTGLGDERGIRDIAAASNGISSGTEITNGNQIASGNKLSHNVGKILNHDSYSGTTNGEGNGVLSGDGNETGDMDRVGNERGKRNKNGAGKGNKRGDGDVHPYGAVIEQQLMSQAVHGLIRFEEPVLPALQDSSPVHFVSTPQQLQELVYTISKCSRVAVDVEHNATHSYLGITCLVQLAADGKDYIIDALKLHDHMCLLHKVFADPSIMKVVHGGGNDVLWLQRDFHLYLVNVFDTEKACRVLHKEQNNLGALLKKYCNIIPDKSQQTSDWHVRPLPVELVRYARSDVHYLLYLADCLWNELLQASGVELGGSLRDLDSRCPAAVALRKSQEVSLGLYHKATHQAAATAAATHLFRRYVMRQTNAPKPAEQPAANSVAAQADPGPKPKMEAVRDCVYALCCWRNEQARKDDEGVQFTLPDAALMHLAESPPASGKEVVQVVRQHVAALNQVLAAQPLAAKFEVSRAVKREAHSLYSMLQSAAAGERPWLGFVDGPYHRDAKSQQQRKQERREIVIKKFSAKSEVYENCRMLSVDGELLCFCDRNKLKWYMSKDLAEYVSDDPPTIRLLFQHKNTDQLAGSNSFYQHSKSNRCVGCGEESNYRRYRVVPSCYRRHFPPQMKSHRSHDVVLVCVDCHSLANKAAEQLKRNIALEYGIPLFPPRALITVPASSLQTGAAPSATDKQVPGDSAPYANGSKDQHGTQGAGVLLADSNDNSHAKTQLQHTRDTAIDPSRTAVGLSDTAVESRAVVTAKDLHIALTTNDLDTAAAAVDVPPSIVQTHSKVQAGNDHQPSYQARGPLKSTPDQQAGDANMQLSQECCQPACALESDVGQQAGKDQQLPDASSNSASNLDPARSGALSSAVVEEHFCEQGGGADDNQELEPSMRSVALFKVRQAALTLQKANEGLPKERRRVLESLVIRYVGREPDEANPGLLPGELERGLLAGLSERKRRQFWKQHHHMMGQMQAGGEDGQPTSTAVSTARRNGFIPDAEDVEDKHKQGGHMRHGQQLVDLLLSTGQEEALVNLVQRFRRCFVEAVQPKFLPPSWDVTHNAMRDFGEYSIYHLDMPPHST